MRLWSSVHAPAQQSHPGRDLFTVDRVTESALHGWGLDHAGINAINARMSNEFVAATGSQGNHGEARGSKQRATKKFPCSKWLKQLKQEGVRACVRACVSLSTDLLVHHLGTYHWSRNNNFITSLHKFIIHYQNRWPSNPTCTRITLPSLWM